MRLSRMGKWTTALMMEKMSETSIHAPLYLQAGEVWSARVDIWSLGWYKPRRLWAADRPQVEHIGRSYDMDISNIPVNPAVYKISFGLNIVSQKKRAISLSNFRASYDSKMFLQKRYVTKWNIMLRSHQTPNKQQLLTRSLQPFQLLLQVRSFIGYLGALLRQISADPTPIWTIDT